MDADKFMLEARHAVLAAGAGLRELPCLTLLPSYLTISTPTTLQVHILCAVAQLHLPIPRPLLARLGSAATADATLVHIDALNVSLLMALAALRLPLSPQWLEIFAGAWRGYILLCCHACPCTSLPEHRCFCRWDAAPFLYAGYDGSAWAHSLCALPLMSACPLCRSE